MKASIRKGLQPATQMARLLQRRTSLVQMTLEAKQKSWLQFDKDWTGCVDVAMFYPFSFSSLESCGPYITSI